MNPASADPTHTTPIGSILLAEDDAVSREFLSAALSELPAKVVAVADAAAAIARASSERFDLLVLDRRLPQATALAIREAIVANAGINAGTPMLALSADVDTRLKRQFQTAGFVDLLAKPITAVALRAAVREILGAAIWDQQHALAAANGNPAIVRRLRDLLCADLPAQQQRIETAIADSRFEIAHAELHRLKAACAFCGAAQLALASNRLDNLLRAESCESNAIHSAAQDFVAACSALLVSEQAID